MFKVIYTSEFSDWLKKIENKEFDSIIKLINQLKREGFMLTEPYSKKIKGSKCKLRELRCMRFNNRVYYFLEENKLYVCLLGGKKTTQTKDIKKAENIAKDIKDKNYE